MHKRKCHLMNIQQTWINFHIFNSLLISMLRSNIVLRKCTKIYWLNQIRNLDFWLNQTALNNSSIWMSYRYYFTFHFLSLKMSLTKDKNISLVASKNDNILCNIHFRPFLFLIFRYISFSYFINNRYHAKNKKLVSMRLR